MFGYLVAAEELILLLFKLVQLILPAALPAVALHHLLRLHLTDETEQPILPCNKEINPSWQPDCSFIPGAAVCSEAQSLLGREEREGEQVTTRLER